MTAVRDRITVRLPADLRPAIEAHRRALAAETCLDVTITDAVFALVRRGLRVVEAPTPVTASQTTTHEKQRRAYEMHAAGASWTEVAAALGYAVRGSAAHAARAHAKRHGLARPKGVP